MTSEQIKKHNRAFAEAMRLINGEILLDEHHLNSNCKKSVRLRLEEAKRLLERTLEINPENWSAMWFLGKIHQRLGDNSAAFNWFCEAHDINPSQADVAREASICAMSLGRSEEAIHYASDAVQSQPDNNGLLANLALAFLLAGNVNDADTTIGKVILNDPKDKISKTVYNMVKHFINDGKKPPTTTAALEDYWKKHNKSKIIDFFFKNIRRQ